MIMESEDRAEIPSRVKEERRMPPEMVEHLRITILFVSAHICLMAHCAVMLSCASSSPRVPRYARYSRTPEMAEH